MENNTLKIENAKIIFRNFVGRKTKYNTSGSRNFCVIIPDEKTAMEMKEDGWNVKTLEPRDEYEKPTYYLQAKVNYGSNPPKIYVHTRKTTTLLTEDTIANLDNADIINTDVAIRPYHYDVNGKTGISAYVKTMHITVEEDEFADKYATEEFPEEVPF